MQASIPAELWVSWYYCLGNISKLLLCNLSSFHLLYAAFLRWSSAMSQASSCYTHLSSWISRWTPPVLGRCCLEKLASSSTCLSQLPHGIPPTNSLNKQQSAHLESRACAVLHSFLFPHRIMDPTIEWSLQPWLSLTIVSPTSSSLSVNSRCQESSPCLIHPVPLSRSSPLLQSKTLKIGIEMIKIWARFTSSHSVNHPPYFKPSLSFIRSLFYVTGEERKKTFSFMSKESSGRNAIEERTILNSGLLHEIFSYWKVRKNPERSMDCLLECENNQLGQITSLPHNVESNSDQYRMPRVWVLERIQMKDALVRNTIWYPRTQSHLQQPLGLDCWGCRLCLNHAAKQSWWSHPLQTQLISFRAHL